MTAVKDHNVDEIMEFVERFAEGRPVEVSKAMFYFLYKEILLNRIDILETKPADNRGAIDFNEKIINALNAKLMDHLENHGG